MPTSSDLGFYKKRFRCRITCTRRRIGRNRTDTKRTGWDGVTPVDLQSSGHQLFSDKNARRELEIQTGISVSSAVQTEIRSEDSFASLNRPESSSRRPLENRILDLSRERQLPELESILGKVDIRRLPGRGTKVTQFHSAR